MSRGDFQLRMGLTRSRFWGRHDKYGISDAFGDIERRIDVLQQQVDLIMEGIDLPEYNQFQRLTPAVTFVSGSSFSLHEDLDEAQAPSRDDALFCYRFALDSLLLMRESRELPSLPRYWRPDRRLRVIEDCDIIVSPSDDPEVIRRATKGEILSGVAGQRFPKDHLLVFDDADDAYVLKTAVEEIGEESEPTT